MPKLKLTLETISNPAFLPAFEKLGEDNLGGKEKYAIGRSLRDVKSHRETYEEQRIALVKKFGKPNEEILSDKLAMLKALPNQESLAGQIKQVEAQLSYITANKVKGWSIDEADEKAMEGFKSELKEMQKTEIDIFLDHRINLPADTKLSGAEISQLLDIIEEPSDASAK